MEQEDSLFIPCREGRALLESSPELWPFSGTLNGFALCVSRRRPCLANFDVLRVSASGLIYGRCSWQIDFLTSPNLAKLSSR
jgi:hypothetical protein